MSISDVESRPFAGYAPSQPIAPPRILGRLPRQPTKMLSAHPILAATASEAWLLLKIVAIGLFAIFNFAVAIRMIYAKHPGGTKWVLIVVGSLVMVGGGIWWAKSSSNQRELHDQVSRARAANSANWEREQARINSLTPQELALERKFHIDTAYFRYFADHRRYPSFARWGDLTEAPAGSFLPAYLAGPVENPITHSSTIQPAFAAQASDGWEYDSATGTVWPVGLQRPPTTKPAAQSRSAP